MEMRAHGSLCLLVPIKFFSMSSLASFIRTELLMWRLHILLVIKCKSSYRHLRVPFVLSGICHS